jgi:ABC-2 type transport system ATP-binding protein
MEILKVEALTRKFSPTTGIEGINFNLKAGRVLAYLGHNGAGKTTTIRALLGLLKADSGEIRYFGSSCDTASVEFDRLRRDVGVCLDAPGFYADLDAMANLRLYAGLYGLEGKVFETRAKELLERLGLAEAGGKKVKEYSRGMTQKLALIRAVQHKPRLLFLDEPMSGLDPEARITMRDFLGRLAEKENVSIFLTSHDLNEVEQIAHDVIILEKGRVKLSGELEALKESFRKIGSCVLVLEALPEPERIAAIASSLGAVNHCVQGRKLGLDCAAEVSMEAAAAACAKAGVKLAEFRKERATLEDIYFESLKKNEK